MINQSMLKKVDMPANLFSNLGGKDYSISKVYTKEDDLIENKENISEENIVKTNNALAEDMKEYYEQDTKLNNLDSKKEYRTRLNKMYEELKNITPIDSEIKDTMFTSNYIEKGIVIKPTISELKQFWTEYRLMHNENKSKNKDNNYPNPSNLYTQNQNKNEFEELFNNLTTKVQEINGYIEELKEWRNTVNSSKEQIAEDKEKLELDRQEFLNYKQEEEEKIRKEKETLKNNFNRLQNIINKLDTSLNEVE